jgi:hypothetical protein
VFRRDAGTEFIGGVAAVSREVTTEEVIKT